MSRPSAGSVPLNPQLLLDLATRFMASKLFFAANELGLFAALQAGPLSLSALADQIKTSPRAARIVADAMVAQQLLVRSAETYANSPTAQAFLTGQGPMDFRPLLRMFEHLEYPAWQHLTATLRDGFSPELMAPMSEAELPIFHQGIEIFTLRAAHALLAQFDFSGRHRLLDIGGGSGSFLQVILSAQPHLHGTLFELPDVAALARVRFASSPLRDRLTILDGDALAEDLPTDADTILVANLIHLLAPSHTVRLLRQVRTVAQPTTQLLLLDLWTNANHTQPVTATLLAGEFAIRSNFGDVYSVEEATAWLHETGWQLVEHRPLGDPMSVLIAKPV